MWNLLPEPLNLVHWHLLWYHLACFQGFWIGSLVLCMVMVRDGETLHWEVITSLGVPLLEGINVGLMGLWVVPWE